MKRASVVVVKNQEGNILLTKRSSDLRMYPNHWVFPGGLVDEGETFLDAAKREVQEEIGLDILSNHTQHILTSALEDCFVFVYLVHISKEQESMLMANTDEIRDILFCPTTATPVVELLTKDIVTFLNCDVRGDNPAVNRVHEFYSDGRAKRSGIKLMNHISEGMDILKGRGMSDEVLSAFALHPLVQDSSNLLTHITGIVAEFDSHTVYYALKYRDLANAYLCSELTDKWTDDSLRNLLADEPTDVIEMLRADKIQNYKDFILYHQGVHERSKELTSYFERWIRVTTSMLSKEH